MNKHIYRFVAAAILIAALFSSCKSKKGIIRNNKKKPDSAVIIEKVKGTSLEYNSIEIKGSAKTELDGKKYNFSIVYRNYKDSQIWVSVRAMLGIEVARLKCTPEKVWIFSRLADVNEQGDWSKMAKFLGYPIDFYTFQGMMTRSLFVPGHGALDNLLAYIQRESESGILLVPDYNSESFVEKNKETEFWPQYLVDAKDFSIIKTRIVPTRNEWQFEADYGAGGNPQFGGLSNNFVLKAIDENQDLELSFKIQNVILNQELKMPYQWE